MKSWGFIIRDGRGANWMYGSNTDVHKPKKDTTEKWKLRVRIGGCEMLIPWNWES